LRHIPVLLGEVLEHLAITPAGTYADCTAGSAGYAEAILERLTTGHLIAIDRDEEAIARSRERLRDWGDKVTFVNDSFGRIKAIANEQAPLAGIVADLGVSREQLDDTDRGFSFRFAAPLDMRMRRPQALTAEHILNYYGEQDLTELLYKFGEEPRAKRIANAIVRVRPSRDTGQRAELVERAVPRAYKQRIHPATRTFQAIRIAVNDELGELQSLLADGPQLLGPGGRMVVVSYHSLEDRLVKNAFREGVREGRYRAVTRRVVRPTPQEIAANHSCRAAKLRAIERVH
jgi:16S rRNA (cytosine1402-N4)-methyltransferase